MVDYSGLFEEIINYEKVILTDDERSVIFKIINETETSNLINYLKKVGQYPTLEDNEIRAYKLQKMRLIEQYQSRFLRGKSRYRLTTFGLFYIFSEITTYPPDLLTKYQENILLKKLICKWHNQHKPQQNE